LRLSFVHAGALYGRRDPMPFLAAIRALLDARPSLATELAVRFIGYNGDPDLARKARACLAGRQVAVSIEPEIPHRQALEALAVSAVLLLLGPSTTEPDHQVPAKLFEYLASGRAILALCHREGAIARVLRESTARYWIAPPDDVDLQARALAEIADAHSRGELVRGPSALPARFERARQAERLDGILRAICDNRH
jgi:glycosyltransferase involved in cell wall biosynthesis